MICAAGRACGQPAVDGGPLCVDCLRSAARAIEAIPGGYAGLAARLEPARRPAGQRVDCGGGDGHSVPVDLAVIDLQREVVWALTVWEPPVREALDLPPGPERGVRPTRAVAGAARLLAAHVGALAALPPVWCFADGVEAGPVLRDGLDAVRQVLAVARRVAVRADHARLVWVPGQCPCGLAGLRRAAGGDLVDCPGCGRSWRPAAYRRLVGLALDARKVA